MTTDTSQQLTASLYGLDARRTLPPLLATGLLGLTWLFAFTALPGPPCLFKQMFHLPCAGCGLTRSVIALWHLHPGTSFRYHPLGIPIVVTALYVLGRSGAGLVSAPWAWGSCRVSRLLGGSRFLYGLLGAMMALWVARIGLAMFGNGFFLW